MVHSLPKFPKVDKILSEMKFVPALEGGLPAGTLSRMEDILGDRKPALLGKPVREELGNVLAEGSRFYALRKLAPFYYNNSRISLGANLSCANKRLPLAGCTKLPPYKEIRGAAKEVVNPGRFGDGELADSLFLEEDGMPVIDSYLGTLLEAFAATGRALYFYSAKLLEGGNEFNSRAFLRSCEAGVFPLLDSRRRWESGLLLANSLSDAFEGEGGIASIGGMAQITKSVREAMGGGRPIIGQKKRYASRIEEEAINAKKGK
jgi:hypothetical protein